LIPQIFVFYPSLYTPHDLWQNLHFIKQNSLNNPK
jgi:hypothetical protein